VSGSGAGIQQIDFPYLTQWVIVKSNSGTNTVSFTRNGQTNGINLFSVGTTTVLPRLDLRLRTLFVSGSSSTAQWEVIAGLTMVEPTKFPVLSAAFAPGTQGVYSSSSGWGYSTGLG
jgi:hypothetical protein